MKARDAGVVALAVALMSTPSVATALPVEADSERVVVASGTVLDDGVAQRDATVRLVEWTYSADTPVATTVDETSTGADGGYILTAPATLTAASMDATGGSDFHNLELVVMQDQTLHTSHFSLISAESGFVTTSEDQTGQLTESATAHEQTIDLAQTGLSGAEPTRMGTQETRIKVLATYWPWVVVGTYYSTLSTAKASFMHTSGANSSLGVGVSATGKFGSFTRSGTWSSSTSQVHDWDTENGIRSRGYQNQWKYQQERVQYCSVKEGYCYETFYRVVPRYPTAGEKYYVPTRPSAPHCAPQSGSALWSTSAESAVSWSTGVDLKTQIGGSFTAKSGYSSQIKLTVKSGSGPRFLCGTVRVPGGGVYFGQLVVKPQ